MSQETGDFGSSVLGQVFLDWNVLLELSREVLYVSIIIVYIVWNFSEYTTGRNGLSTIIIMVCKCKGEPKWHHKQITEFMV
jgi:hypothetical protein